MNNKAVISILLLFVVIGLVWCNGANKTESCNGTNVTNKTTYSNSTEKKKLFIAVLDKKESDVHAVEPGIQLAIEVAKNSSEFKDFLDKYEIITKVYYTNGKEANAIVTAIHVLRYHSKVDGFALILLGPQTPPEASSLLKLARFYRKLMVTYLTTTPSYQELKDPYGFTFAPSAFTFNKAVKSILKFFKWKRAALVYDFLEADGLYVKTVSNLIEKADFEVIGFEAINTGEISPEEDVNVDIQVKLKKLKDLDAKIFFGAFNGRGASLVFCNLYKMGMYGPEFVWILHPDAETVDVWNFYAATERFKNKTGTCTKEEYEEVADRTIILDKKILYRTDNNTITASGLSLRQAFMMKGFENKKESKKIEFTTAFDTMWSIMLALKEANAEEFPLEYNVENFFGDDTISKTIVSKLGNVSFEGLTGPISFDPDEDYRQGIIGVKQYRTSEKGLVQIGRHDTKKDKFELFNSTNVWKDGFTPYDSSQKKLEPQAVAIELYIVFSIASSIGILLGIMFLVFNRYYRKYRFIRLSAPLFNDVMVVGCIMCLSTVYLFGIRNYGDPKTIMPPICKARAWILNVGFSLAFGAMFIKTWRIYKICTNKRLKVRLGPLSDWWMLAMVGGIVLIDVGIMVAWEIEDPLEWAQQNFTERKDEEKPFIIIIPTLNTCTAKNLTVWLALIYVYKGVLLLYGLFLAYETRNVVYAHLNDSRVIGICVYNVVVLSTIGAFLALILNNHQYEQLYAALSVCIIFPATVTISLIFIPKLIHRMKMSSLEDEAGESTTNTRTFNRPSIDITSTCGYATEMGRERYVDASSANGSVNTLCVYQNGDAGLSPAPSPKPPTKFQEISPKTLED
nr:gamma-aminobutyric acid type B receptor subunit 2-like [Pocillopora verrucosa]XP_058943822.1 gamma-aminobutyric acid type B receptor subunit 2-like [Pocillopora verrucosa]XP_058943823.1 gamma-aminobutyric acid type B receptor subunit 2-like [Pocillopora verrucosa]XP_058943824.1 gamma-aminobutyric acid type B receptor subunit 2-like [Pocillopora verrucosa]XP_058943825.1 gamma-aminobutyric acid type B receptor subunit 2-like [Pocillopora verrucosa]XP_058943826.1 gamma-aminobutyric acid type B